MSDYNSNLFGQLRVDQITLLTDASYINGLGGIQLGIGAALAPNSGAPGFVGVGNSDLTAIWMGVEAGESRVFLGWGNADGTKEYGFLNDQSDQTFELVKMFNSADDRPFTFELTNGSFIMEGNLNQTSTANQVSLSGKDVSVSNARSLSIGTEEAVATAIAVASTHSLKVTINGTEYRILLA